MIQWEKTDRGKEGERQKAWTREKSGQSVWVM